MQSLIQKKSWSNLNNDNNNNNSSSRGGRWLEWGGPLAPLEGILKTHKFNNLKIARFLVKAGVTQVVIKPVMSSMWV